MRHVRVRIPVPWYGSRIHPTFLGLLVLCTPQGLGLWYLDSGSARWNGLFVGYFFFESAQGRMGSVWRGLRFCKWKIHRIIIGFNWESLPLTYTIGTKNLYGILVLVPLILQQCSFWTRVYPSITPVPFFCLARWAPHNVVNAYSTMDVRRPAFSFFRILYTTRILVSRRVRLTYLSTRSQPTPAVYSNSSVVNKYNAFD